MLLKHGADIDFVGRKYGTALAAAALFNHGGVIDILLGNGADINRVGGGYGTALQAAASGGNLDVIEKLLSRGAAFHERKADSMYCFAYTQTSVRPLLQPSTDAELS